jgi:hypothetical protein
LNRIAQLEPYRAAPKSEGLTTFSKKGNPEEGTMSKDDKERDKGFSVKDRRRFSMTEDKKVVENPEAEDKETAGNAKAPSGTEQAPGDAPDKTAGSERREETADLPPMSFSMLILSLSTQAMVNMGEFPDPVSGQINKNLQLAKQSIDLLGILDDKSKGNLTEDEERFLKTSLTDLRLRFVQCCKE